MSAGDRNEQHMADEKSPLLSSSMSYSSKPITIQERRFRHRSRQVYVKMKSFSGSLSFTVTEKRTLKTFSGVFVPVSLSMFSTMLFLRLGFVIGQAGLLEAYTMYLLAYLILFLTILSICAISTNGAVEGGGAYYMISRALGPEFGGSIGSIFFLANAFCCALYISGFTEGIIGNFGPDGNLVHGLPGGGPWWRYLYSTIVCLVCLVVCIFGGKMFTRTLVVIFFTVSLCMFMVLISIFVKSHAIPVRLPDMPANSSNFSSYANYTGLSLKSLRENLFSDYRIDYKTGNIMSFAAVFAILFSSVTGIMNGANMSGELKDPSSSIPRGTLGASLFTFCTFIVLSTFVAASCSRKLLVNDYMFLIPINIWKYFIVIGIFATTLSAALGNLIGASRILEALGNDKLFWSVLKPVTLSTRGGNPYIAVICSYILVQLVLLIGSLNAIAPLVSVFFLLSYASTNLACLALELASAPNFRPTFRFYTWHTCALGLLGCLTMCFLISALYTSIGIIAMLALIIILHFQYIPSSWGYISQALIFHQVRKYLLMLDSRKDHVKYWRPQILLMVANPSQCCSVLDFVNDVKKSGLYILGHVKVSKSSDRYKDDLSAVEQNKWLSLIDHLKIKAFVEITVAESVLAGMSHLCRLCGLGGMKPNTVCMGFYDDTTPVDTLTYFGTHRKRKLFKTYNASDEDNMTEFFHAERFRANNDRVPKSEYVEMIKVALCLRKNLVVCRHFDRSDHPSLKAITSSHGSKMFIDVWPINFFQPPGVAYIDTTCLFMLQLSCILHMVPWWKTHTKLRVFLCNNPSADDISTRERKLRTILHQLRIPAYIELIPWIEEMKTFQSMQDYSLDDSYNSDTDDRPVTFNCPVGYSRAINELIKLNCEQTAITFLYLPKPPTDKENYEAYLSEITQLTNDLPATVLIHGLHAVVSTTL